MFSGFKQFVMRGNVVDLSVGVLIGAAFGNVVNSLVKDILTPLIGAIAKTPDFGTLSIVIGANKINYGLFLNNFISFVIIALVIYLFVVVPINKFSVRKEPDSRKCPECLSEVPIDAKRCKFCTSDIIN